MTPADLTKQLDELERLLAAAPEMWGADAVERYRAAEVFIAIRPRLPEMLSQARQALTVQAERDRLKAEVVDWILVADGIKHDWRCCHGEAETGLCLRCRAESAEAECQRLQSAHDALRERVKAATEITNRLYATNLETHWAYAVDLIIKLHDALTPAPTPTQEQP